MSDHEPYHGSRRPAMLPIRRIMPENPDARTFVFHDPDVVSAALPGNFVMAWLPREPEEPGGVGNEKVVGENPTTGDGHVLDNIPMGISSVEPGRNEFSITVRAVGPTTEALHRCEKGDILGITGPLGNSFTVNGDVNTILVAGGGFGAAPLRFLCEYLRTHRPEMNIFGIFGARTQWEHIFVEDFQRLCDFVLFATDDGSFGTKGFVSDAVEEMTEMCGTPDSLYACGPEPMMFSLRDHPALIEVKEQQYSMERLMRCGIGLCGSCSLENGLWVCRDGPVFDGKVLDEIRKRE